MRPPRTPPHCPATACASPAPGDRPRTGQGRGSLQGRAAEGAPPSSLSAPIRAALDAKGVRVLYARRHAPGRVLAPQGRPATGKPAGAKGSVLFPILAEGELLGAVRYLAEGQDYRDQAIAPGVYTLRYGLQPVNGAHLGVSAYRDYALLSPAAKDATLDDLPPRKLEGLSAEAPGRPIRPSSCSWPRPARGRARRWCGTRR